MNDQLQGILAKLIVQLGDAATHYGPQAIGLAGNYMQLNAIFTLFRDGVIVTMCLIASWVVVRWSRVCARKLCEANKAGEDDSIPGFGLIGLGILGVLIILTLIAYLPDFISPSNWIAALNPQMALVQHVLTNN